MTMGDSKTAVYNGRSWQPLLVQSLREATGINWVYSMHAKGGATMPALLADVDGWIALDPPEPDIPVTDILLNFGVNDQGLFNLTYTLADWTNDWVSLFDDLHGRYPDARIFVTLAYSCYEDDANQLLRDAAVQAAIAQRPAFVFQADDERVWFKGADNCATMSTDLTHYSVVGNAEKANQAFTVLGY